MTKPLHEREIYDFKLKDKEFQYVRSKFMSVDGAFKLKYVNPRHKTHKLLRNPADLLRQLYKYNNRVIYK